MSTIARFFISLSVLSLSAFAHGATLKPCSVIANGWSYQTNTPTKVFSAEVKVTPTLISETKSEKVYASEIDLEKLGTWTQGFKAKIQYRLMRNEWFVPSLFDLSRLGKDAASTAVVKTSFDGSRGGTTSLTLLGPEEKSTISVEIVCFAQSFK